ncbi:MAG: hypothetical protein GY936_02730 [Ignavibacteriae bacterium]|nr:hypothetical protein [Ignavibacteriota bacterium]
MKEKIKNLGWGSIIFLILIYFTIETSYSHKFGGTDYLLLLICSSLFAITLYFIIRSNLKNKFKNIYLSSILSGISSWIITVVVVAQVIRI